jgi:PAS domain S-box-containing protein
MAGSANHEAARTAEATLRAAVEWSPSGLLMIDKAGTIVLVNREVERLFGYAREELLGRPVETLVPERFRSGHPGFRAQFLSEPRVRSMGAGRELFGLRKDGSEVPVEIGLTPVATEEGFFVLSSVVDISARRSAEARFRVAVEAALSGMLMVDEQGTILLVNRAIEDLFGYSREELLGRSVDMLVPVRFRAFHSDSRGSFFAQPETRPMGVGRELFGLHKDGTEIPVEIGLNPIRTDEGLVVLSSVVDIRARKRAEQARRELEEQLRQAQKMEAVGTLAGGIAHDFNNLLGGIIGYAELALEAVEPNSTVARDLDQILTASARGRATVDQLLRFSRRQDAVLKPTDLGQVALEGLKLLRATIPATITIEPFVESKVGRVLADATSAHQVLMNLVTNAAHAMPSGGTLRVSVESTYVRDSMARAHAELHEGPYVRLSVADTGVGMNHVVLQRAFEPFFTTKPPGVGSGLGLAVVHGILRQHSGAVLIDSEVGRGTRVDCYFPLHDLDDSSVHDAEAEEFRGNGEHLLCVDDEPVLLDVMRRRLIRLGYRVTTSSDARAAVDLLRSQPGKFRLALVDYTMPGLTGLDLARAAGELPEPVPVVLVTGLMQDLPAGVLADAGVLFAVRKPLTRGELGRAVSQALSAANAAAVSRARSE